MLKEAFDIDQSLVTAQAQTVIQNANEKAYFNQDFTEKTEGAIITSINTNIFIVCLRKMYQHSKFDVQWLVSPRQHQKEWRQIIQAVSEFMVFKNEYTNYHYERVDELRSQGELLQ